MIITDLWRRLNHLVNEPECTTRGNEYNNIVWNDARPKPTAAALQALTLPVIDAAEQDARAGKVFDESKGMKALALVILAELNALGSTTTPAQFKAAVKTKYKAL